MAELVRYRREPWLTPEDGTIIAPLPDGLLGGCRASLRRFCLELRTQSPVMSERLTSILRAGLAIAAYINVDDTGARQARRDEVTTQIGGERFRLFRTCGPKSRLNFLSLLRARRDDYVINCWCACVTKRKLGISSLAYLGNRLDLSLLVKPIPLSQDRLKARRLKHDSRKSASLTFG